MHRFRFLGVTFLLVAFALTMSGGRASMTKGEAQSEIASDRSKAVLPEVEAYAAYAGVSVTEAEDRLKLQDSIGMLNEQLSREYPNAFAGMYIEHTPSYRIVILFVGGAPDGASQFVTSDIASHIEMRVAKHSLTKLEAARAQAMTDVKEAIDIPVQSGINVQDNIAELYVAGLDGVGSSAQRIRDFLQNPTPELVGMVRVVELESLSEHVDANAIATVRGGAKLWETGGSSYCTAGFSVSNPWTGERGITTAGHCANDSSYFKWTSFALTYRWGTSGGVYDIQWHSTQPTQNVVNEIDIGNWGIRSITGKKWRGNQVVGEWVCKYGRTTGPGCGTIVDTYFDGVNVRANVVVDEGDSGGPWFVGSTAYGTTIAKIGSHAVYGPVDHIYNILYMQLLTW